MSEFSPFHEETSPQPEQVIFIDMLKAPVWGELRDKAIKAETTMTFLEDEDQVGPTVIAKQAELAGDLSGVLDQYYAGQTSHVFGFVYSEEYISDDDAEDSGLEMIDSKKVVYLGTDIHYVRRRWRAMTELYLKEPTENLPVGLYYAPLAEDVFMSFHIREPSDEQDSSESDIVEFINKHAERSRKLIHSNAFAQMTPAEQRNWLQQDVADVDGHLPAELRNKEVTIDCLEYFVVYDDMPELMLPETINGAAHEVNIEPLVVTGKIIRSEYTELCSLPVDEKLSPASFNLNDSMSFMVIRSEEKKLTYYVPSQDVLAIG